MHSIAFYDTKVYDKEAFVAANTEYGYAFTFLETRLNEETVSLAHDHDVVCVFVNDIVNRAVIQSLQEMGISLIALRCAGYNQVDLQALQGAHLTAVRVPHYSPHAVAEHTIALILAVNRKIHRAYLRTRDHDFRLDGLQGFDMVGKTAGVIGTGIIGKIVAQILSSFGMRILAHDTHADNDWATENGIEYVDLPTLYRESHVITLHCPLTPETEKMINHDSIRLMRDGVILVNTGRGHLIETKALIQGLKEKKIGAAALDVYEEEADFFFENYAERVIRNDTLALLLTFPNVLVTAHQAFFTQEALTNIAHTTLENIRSFFAGNAANRIL